MKLQVITRNGRYYFHVYLPKNIIQHVLKWERGEELSFSVMDDGLIIRKSNTPNFKDDNWNKILECDNCKIKTAFIKGRVRKDEFILVSRCPKCKQHKKILLTLKEKDNWLDFIEEMIERCDICGNKDLEQLRVRYGWDWKSENYAKIVYYCPNCELERTKIVPHLVLMDLKEHLNQKTELPVFKCVYCNYKIENYDIDRCPNCNNIITCKRCGNFIIERSRYCVHCGEEIEDFSEEIQLETRLCPFCDEITNYGALFCERCGNLISCIVCGAPLKDSTNYCGKCGTNVKKDINLSNLIEK